MIVKLIDPKRVISLKDTTSPDKTQRLDIDNTDIGVFNIKGVFCLRQSEVSRIQTHFSVFNLNRLNYEGKKMARKKESMVEQAKKENSFKP